MPDQNPEQVDSERRLKLAQVFVTFADAVARITELFLRR